MSRRRKPRLASNKQDQASWQLPGGHLERGEGLLGCAAREAREETGLDVEPFRVVATTYDAFAAERKHYVTWFVPLQDAGCGCRA